MNHFFDQKQLYLIGFMGAGKTTIGKLLAQKLKRPFLDIDDIIEQHAQLTIPMIFEKFAEGYFRQRETEALDHIASQPAHVVATGGGIVLADANRKIMKETGITIYLKWRTDVLLMRLKNSTHRPLLKSMNESQLVQQIDAMLNQRLPFYEAADMIIAADDRTTPLEIAELIHQQLQAKFEMCNES